MEKRNYPAQASAFGLEPQTKCRSHPPAAVKRLRSNMIRNQANLLVANATALTSRQGGLGGKRTSANGDTAFDCQLLDSNRVRVETSWTHRSPSQDFNLKGVSLRPKVRRKLLQNIFVDDQLRAS